MTPPEALSPCPHCRGMTVLVPHPSLRWVCGACGGPRVPASEGAPSAAVDRLLADVKRERFSSVAFRVASGFALVSAFFALGIAALLFPFTRVGMAVLGVVGLGLLGLGLHLLRRGSVSKAKARDAFDAAWVAAAAHVVRARAGTTAPELATVMQTDVADAERLLGRLSADDEVRVRVAGGEGAELVYEGDQETLEEANLARGTNHE